MREKRQNFIWIIVLSIVFILIGIVFCLRLTFFKEIFLPDNQISALINDRQTSTLQSQSTTNDGWELLLVNKWNSIPKDYEIPLLEIGGGNMIDERCFSDLQNMLSDCYKAGLEPLICSSYRSVERQQELFQQKVNECLKGGYSQKEAEEMVERVIAFPGTSEHHLGLALDIVDMTNQILSEEQEDTKVQKWLLENSWKYGFILRYPNNKSEITGIIYEPWHYRYVGIKAAKEIHNLGICFEEYLDIINEGGQ